MYGVTLWPSAIALAHDLAARGNRLRDLRVLELGAGTGLPGIVAASFGARVIGISGAGLGIDRACFRAMKALGAVGVLEKPLDREALLALLDGPTAA